MSSTYREDGKSEFGIARGVTKERRHSIDLGLALLSVLRKPGVPLTQQDIAAWCGCARGYIYVIEKRALTKLRNRLKFMRETDPRLAEMVEEIFQAREVAVRTEAA